MDMELLWAFVVIGGPVILGIAIAWGVLTSRRSAKAEARTEKATRKMYDEQNAEDVAAEAQDAR